MRALALAAAAALASCGGMPRFPDPAADRGQLVVRLDAKPRKGVRAPRTVGGEDAYSIRKFSLEEGRAYERVDYRRLDGLAVLLEGVPAGAGPGPVPREITLTLHADRIEPSLGLLAPGGQGVLKVSNRREAPVTVVLLGPQSAEARIPAGGAIDLVLRDPGEYEVVCEEAETLGARVLVAPSEFAAMGRSGDWVLFDGLPPGSYGVRVVSARLPEWRGRIALEAGKRALLEATVGVDALESVRP